MMNTKEKNTINIISLSSYTFSHFCVDFACFFFLFSWYYGKAISPEKGTIWMLIYNIIAFGLQPLLGYLLDNKNGIPLDLIGLILLIIGSLLPEVFVVAILLMALGNACFHVAGGVACLKMSKGRIFDSGVFVSSGALGVGLGTLLGRSGNYPFFFPTILLLVCLFIQASMTTKNNINEDEIKYDLTKKELKFEVIILITFVAIGIRAYGGSILPLNWRTSSWLFLFPSIGAFLGKFLGGYIADSLGAKETAVYSLIASAIILTFFYHIPGLYLVGIILFNMNMSITLCLLAGLLPENPGLAFGITTLALLVGNFFTFFIVVKTASIVFITLTLGSATCLWCILKGRKI